MMEKEKLLEPKRKKFGDIRRLLDSTHKCNQEVCNNHSMSDSSLKRKRVGNNGNFELKSPVMVRAEEVLAHLGTKFPSFLKTMIHSHVTYGFYMTLPKDFRLMHIPERDGTIILIDETGEEYEVNYLVERRAISAGWKRFCDDHKLVEGDVLLFQLVRSWKFKVYIVRIDGLSDVDAAVGLLSLGAHGKKKASEMLNMKEHAAKAKHPKPLPQENGNHNIQSNGLIISNAEFGSEYYSSEDVGDVVSSSVSPCVSKKLASSYKFNIVVDDQIIDSELPEHVRIKYNELCQSQNSCLHENLLENIDDKFAAGLISEFVKVADAIRGCKPSTPQDDFMTWLAALNGFEQFGLNANFLRTRVTCLMNIAFGSKLDLKMKRYRQLKDEQACVEMEIRKLESRLSALKEEIEWLDPEIKALKSYMEK